MIEEYETTMLVLIEATTVEQYFLGNCHRKPVYYTSTVLGVWGHNEASAVPLWKWKFPNAEPK